MVGEERDGATRYYRAWESPFETDRETLGTDIGAVHAGYASLTPLLLDRTALGCSNSPIAVDVG